MIEQIDNFSVFIEKNFTSSAEEKVKEKALQKLRIEFPSFNEWNEEAKKALLEREIADCINSNGYFNNVNTIRE